MWIQFYENNFFAIYNSLLTFQSYCFSIHLRTARKRPKRKLHDVVEWILWSILYQTILAAMTQSVVVQGNIHAFYCTIKSRIPENILRKYTWHMLAVIYESNAKVHIFFSEGVQSTRTFYWDVKIKLEVLIPIVMIYAMLRFVWFYYM